MSLAKCPVYSKQEDTVVDYNGQGRGELDQSIFRVLQAQKKKICDSVLHTYRGKRQICFVFFLSKAYQVCLCFFSITKPLLLIVKMLDNTET